MLFHVVISQVEAKWNNELLNLSIQNSLSECRRVGTNENFYILSIEAESKMKAPELFRLHKLMTTAELNDYLQTSFEIGYVPPNPRKTIESFGDDQGFSMDGQHKAFSAARDLVNPNMTTHDFLMAKRYAISGGYLYTEAAKLGDTVIAKVIDTENYLGFGAGAAIGQFLNWGVAPGVYQPAVSKDVSIMPIAGLTLRIEYHAVAGAVPATGFINYVLHEVK